VQHKRKAWWDVVKAWWNGVKEDMKSFGSVLRMHRFTTSGGKSEGDWQLANSSLPGK